MIDTIKVTGHGTVASDVPSKTRVTIRNHVRFYHNGDTSFWWAEVELPKLLPAGHNGVLIVDQEELTEAWHRFHEAVLAKVAISDYRIARLDICWQYAAPATDVIAAMQWQKHPQTRRGPILWPDGKQATYGSKKSGWELGFYSKAPGVLRAELRLGKRHLAKRVDVNQPPDCGLAWHLLRGALAPLASIQLPEEKRHSFAEILASLPPESRSQGMAVYRQGRTARAYSEFAKDVSTAALAGTGFRLVDLVGTDGQPPPAVHAPPPKRRGDGRRFRSDKPLVATPQAIRALSRPDGQTVTCQQPDGLAGVSDADADTPHLGLGPS